MTVEDLRVSTPSLEQSYLDLVGPQDAAADGTAT